jgi:hypothetical protein
MLIAGFAETKQMFSTMMITAPLSGPHWPPSVLTTSPLSPGLVASTPVLIAQDQRATAVRRIHEGVAWKTSSTWQSWGLHGTVIKSTRGQPTDYNVVIRLHLPVAWWFSSHVLNGKLTVSVLRQNTLTLRHPSYFAVAYVLDFSHPFFEACRSNDVAVVREMLRNGEGRPTDVNPRGYGPFWVRARQVCSATINRLTGTQYAVNNVSVEAVTLTLSIRSSVSL